MWGGGRVGEAGEVITLLDEEGTSHAFSLVDVVEIDARRYAILEPVDGGAAAAIFRVEDETLVAITDDVEFDRVLAVLESSGDYDDVTLLDDQDGAGDGGPAA